MRRSGSFWGVSLGVLTLGAVGWLVPAARGADLDAEPIRYTTAADNNAVSRLQRQLEAGKASLTHEDGLGYLRSVLRALDVPESSQVLVFSKTSLQHRRIGPRTPRALYFNDDVYIGFCQRGTLIEVMAADANLGSVFYSLGQKETAKPRFKREGESCLVCHGSSRNDGLPGPLVRSLFTDAEGYGILSAGSFRVDHTTPLKHRWGGWYVTGTSGKQTHLGNLILQDKQVNPEELDNSANINLKDLAGRLDTGAYPTGHSDIVALMVLEHQAGMHNLITRANFLTRIALHDEAVLNQALGRGADYRSESTTSRIKNAGEPLVKYMLFSGEVRLTEKVQGTSGFARDFVRRGPRDQRGRSLRDLDLEHRLFRYPCSYLIGSAAFEGLPGPVKDYVLQRLWDVLSGKDTSADFAHLSSADRQAIREILLETKPNLPAYWRQQVRR
jgi:hypothetical protein